MGTNFTGIQFQRHAVESLGGDQRRIAYLLTTLSSNGT